MKAKRGGEFARSASECITFYKAQEILRKKTREDLRLIRTSYFIACTDNTSTPPPIYSIQQSSHFHPSAPPGLCNTDTHLSVTTPTTVFRTLRLTLLSNPVRRSCSSSTLDPLHLPGGIASTSKYPELKRLSLRSPSIQPFSPSSVSEIPSRM